MHQRSEIPGQPQARETNLSSLPPSLPPYLSSGHRIGGEEIAVLLQQLGVGDEGDDLTDKGHGLLLQGLGVA